MKTVRLSEPDAMQFRVGLPLCLLFFFNSHDLTSGSPNVTVDAVFLKNFTLFLSRNGTRCAKVFSILEEGVYALSFRFRNSTYRCHLKATDPPACHSVCGSSCPSFPSDHGIHLLGNMSFLGNSSLEDLCSLRSSRLDLSTLISFGVALTLMFAFALLVLYIRCRGPPTPIPEDLQHLELFRQILVRRFVGRPEDNNDAAVAQKLLTLEHVARLQSRQVNGKPKPQAARRYQEMNSAPQVRFDRQEGQQSIEQSRTRFFCRPDALLQEAMVRAKTPVPKPRTRRRLDSGPGASPKAVTFCDVLTTDEPPPVPQQPRSPRGVPTRVGWKI